MRIVPFHDLVSAVATRCNDPRDQARRMLLPEVEILEVLRAFADEIVAQVRQGQRVQVTGLGVFYKKRRAAAVLNGRPTPASSTVGFRAGTRAKVQVADVG